MIESAAEYLKILTADVALNAEAGGQLTVDSFFDYMTEQMEASSELDDAVRAHLSRPGMLIDGWGGSPAEHGGVLTLLLVDHSTTGEVETLIATQLDVMFRRGLKFLERALDRTFRRELEETSPVFDMADAIAVHWSATTKIRLIVLSNRALSRRVDRVEAGEFQGRSVAHSVWELDRSWRYANSRTEREEIEVDFEGAFGGSIPALPAHLSDDANYEGYLAVIPGRQLAMVFDQWGTRLLEQNVRVFLQASNSRGVNAGIKRTIDTQPEMFFAYNNGLSATAEQVEVRTTRAGTEIVSARNLQIVNGGQTTASLHAALMRKEPGLDRVFVQMKLSIVEPDETTEVIPRISRFANSQNKISDADFFSNHPFHVEIEAHSRRELAPPRANTLVPTKWFYERARGQYVDARTRGTGAARKKFEQEYPRSQLITKTDLAKYLNSWAGKPEIVSRGAQKNFAIFAEEISRAWERDPHAFNVHYYQQAIANAIAFKATERLVSAQPWYEGGFRANIVAYACAKLAHDADAAGGAINFDAVWRNQDIGSEFEAALVIATKAAHDVLTAVNRPMPNVTEWAKAPACWSRLQHARISWPSSWVKSWLSREEQAGARRSARRDNIVTSEVIAEVAVFSAGREFWRRLRSWGDKNDVSFNLAEQRAFNMAEKMPPWVPSSTQANVLLTALKQCREMGFPEQLPESPGES